jgi:AcrR family transcriptional regulator
MPRHAPSPMKKKPTVKRRLTQEDRREIILEQAIKVFAEKGFGASTRDLAQRIGITQPLLFQHFPSKDDLIQAVFAELFERMSTRDWLSKLRDDKLDLRSRLIDFFMSYATSLYDFHWIRIYMFAGLEGGAFNRMYIGKLTEPLLREVAAQIRRDRGMKRCAPSDVSAREVELLWILHGGLYYSAIRKQIYRMPIQSVEVRPLIQYGVDSILSGMNELLDDLEAKRKNRSSGMR